LRYDDPIKARNIVAKDPPLASGLKSGFKARLESCFEKN
jgi:hypothetical protein